MNQSKCTSSLIMGTISLILLAAFIAAAIGCSAPVSKQYDPPGKTSWAPQGCRTLPSDNPALGLPLEFFRTLHGDTLNSDEVSIALTPVFASDWVAEKNFWLPDSPTFDHDGNIYLSPVLPAEEVVMVSLDPKTGARRWAVPGFSFGGGAPLVLNDPADFSQQIIYLGTYDRAFAFKPDGTRLWEVTTGLPTPPRPTIDSSTKEYHSFGLNYLPQADALVGVMGDGHLYVLDRATGASLLPAPFMIPGEPSPPRPATKLPASILKKANDDLLALLGGLPAGASALGNLIDIVLGYSSKVANYFAIDPNTGYMWINATAPDAEDGTVDGISSFGALYCMELSPDHTQIIERFHTSFEGGSACTPTLNADGTRVYVGDNLGSLIAVDASNGLKIWERSVGQQIIGSVSVTADNKEIYAATGQAIIKVIDMGTVSKEIWRSTLDMYKPGIGQSNFNLSIVGAGANGIFFHGGAGYVLNGISLPLRVGIGLVDRETGKIRYFADGPEESVSALNTGPDGAVYLGNSPIRRAMARAIFPNLTPPLTGGVTRYAPKRLDLLIRDAGCAAAARALNAFDNRDTCSDAVAVDIRQIQLLIDQCRSSAPQAIIDGDISFGEWFVLDGLLVLAQADLSPDSLNIAAENLQQVCDYFTD
jgi:outer membrane protein assembly factor BamB